ncbi:hypothetical protein MC378_10480 [Polaribacter sp. MSW13]|uniref:Uncharacterized protein n=1 Tax=Polaribacter marinus TaxID=2916838 RepID=A0A9X1VN54_9FLAO|nr:hypothetical protein [Polaribacter marinus]MCI2229594.1 hypothetical protein [Polaribacter marinus]
MKAQITTAEKIHKEFPSGEPCYVTRVTPIYEQRLKDRVYTILTYESQKEPYNSLELDENGEVVLENDEPKVIVKYRTILGRQIHATTFKMTIDEINGLSSMIESQIPDGLTAWNKERFEAAVALQYKTKNDPDLENGFMDYQDWELDTE